MTTPPLRRRRLARTLTQLREDAGLSLTDAAAAADFSQSKLSRIESTGIAISGDDTYTLCGVLGVGEELTNALVGLARQAKRRDWWAAYPRSVIGRSTDLLELEADATLSHSFTLDVVPGLLQTEDYARAVMQHGMPRESNESIDQRVALRMQRQQRIRDGGLDYWAIIDEPALHRPLGGDKVIANQIEYLCVVAATRHVSLQVLPLETCGHPGLGAPFSVFELPDGYRCVAVDNLSGGLYIEDEREVRTYEDTWSRLAAAALSFEQSAERLAKIASEHRRRTGEARPRPLRVAKEHSKQQQ